MVGPETGRTQPGKFIVCGDSHTATHGAFGAIAFGIGTSEVEHVLATQTIWQVKPKRLLIEFVGQAQRGVYAKDFILALIALRCRLWFGSCGRVRRTRHRPTQYGRADDHLQYVH